MVHPHPIINRLGDIIKVSPLNLNNNNFTLFALYLIKKNYIMVVWLLPTKLIFKNGSDHVNLVCEIHHV